MAKFCTKCGSVLEDGKPCKCEKEIVKEEKVIKTNSVGIMDLLKEYFEIVKTIFKKPVDVIKDNNNENKFNLSLVSIAVCGLSMGLFICMILKNIFGSYSNYIEIPYAKSFLMGFGAAVVLFALMALIAYIVIDKIFKKETSIKKMFVLFGINSTFVTVTLLLATILTLVKLDYTIIYIVIAGGSLLSLANNIKGIEIYTKLNENLIGYAMVIITGVTSGIMYYIVTDIFPKMFI